MPSFKIIVSFSAGFFTFVELLTPLPEALNTSKTKNLILKIERPIIEFVMLLSNITWFLYGLTQKEVALTLMHFIGIFFSAYYSSISFNHSTHKNELKFPFRFIGVMISLALLGSVIFSIQTKELLYGIFAVIFDLAIQITPLYQFRRIFQTKNNPNQILFFASIISFCVNFSWIFYGIVISDIFVTIPSSIGAFLNLIQLYIYLHFRFGIRFRLNNSSLTEIL
ncbi:sugar transporter sweet1 [Anaeramoeba ignava]|uniref:Sugar transporter sweet1 n=1 Tax=Anaeramoeba ignava TaxID=1746090 RepID=A0A9Q0L869_ANAIG|nr:sugar transporter sweet1 [Anaeramoeba ignava]